MSKVVNILPITAGMNKQLLTMNESRIRFAEELLGHLEYPLMVMFTQDIACWIKVSVRGLLWMQDGCSHVFFPTLSAAPGGSTGDDGLLCPATS